MIKISNLINEDIKIGNYIIFKGERTREGSYWIKNVKTGKMSDYALNSATVKYLENHPKKFIEWVRGEKI